MKTKIGTNIFAELREHKLTRARKLDRKERIPSAKRITFECDLGPQEKRLSVLPPIVEYFCCSLRDISPSSHIDGPETRLRLLPPVLKVDAFY
jgi:hypothetical protein